METKEQIKPKANREKEIIKIGGEINEIENKKNNRGNRGNQWNQKLVFENIKIDKHLSKEQLKKN